MSKADPLNFKKKPRVLVTGADGFLGLNLTKAWNDKFHLTAFILPERKSFYEQFCAQLSPSPATQPALLTGRFSELPNYAAALSEVEYVVHCAGNMLGRKKERYDEANSESVEWLLSALEKHAKSLRRVVLLSSQAALGPSLEKTILTEVDSPNPVSFYGESKLEGERKAQKFFTKLPITILRPCSIYGPWDKSFLRMFRLARKGKMGFLYDREKFFNLLHVSDLIRGIELAFEDEGSGQTYLLSDDKVHDWNDVKTIYSQIFKRPMKSIYMNAFWSDLYLKLFDLREILTGKPDILSSVKAREIRSKYWLCSAQKFRNKFSFETKVSLEKGFKELAQWYEDQGWI